MPSIFIRILAGFFILFYTFSAFGNLTTAINHLLAEQSRNEKIGIYIQNLENKSVLYAHNSNVLFTPASTTKVFTAAAAYLSLGPDYRYETILSTNAPVGQVLKGNVYLRFSGDPTLTSQDIFALINEMRYKGVREVTGNIILDQSVFSGPYYGAGWDTSDYAVCYGAPASGAIINSNCGNWGVVREPDLYAREIVHLALVNAGIYVKGKIEEGKTPAGTRTVAVHYSDSLQSILGYMLKYSDDVYANAIFKTIGKNYYNVGSYYDGSRATSAILVSHFGKGFQPPRLKDGSGLSTMNLISPKQLVTLYNYMYHEPGLTDLFMESLAISGQGGTLVHRLTDPLLAGKVYAKTGTLYHDRGGVSALAGYLILPDRPVIGFAIMVNNTDGNNSRAEALQDRILQLVADNEV